MTRNPNPEPRAPSPEPSRHFDDEEFPEHCDHCPKSFGPAEPYRRVQFVIDAAESRVGVDRASVEYSFELVLCSSCAMRIERWVRTPLGFEPVDTEIVDELDEGELMDALERELVILDPNPVVRSPSLVRRALGVVGGRSADAVEDCERLYDDDGRGDPTLTEGALPIETDVSKWRNVSGVDIFEIPDHCPLHREGRDIVCYDCYRHLVAHWKQRDARKARAASPGVGSPLSAPERVVREALRDWSVMPKPEDMHGAADQFPGDDHHMLGKDDDS